MTRPNSLNFSYWERTSFIDDADFMVIGSGLVGLSAALHLKKLQPSLKVTVIDSGFLPSGASTKNAGFACFGTISEQLKAIKQTSEDEMVKMADYRFRGLKRLKQNLGSGYIRYEQHGGYELFTQADKHKAAECLESIAYINKLLSKVVNNTDIYAVADAKIAGFGFQDVNQMIVNKYEGQIHTGCMMRALLYKAYQAGVMVLNSCRVQQIDEQGKEGHIIITSQGNFKANKVIVANNAFATQLYPKLNMVAGRGQVLITKPVANLKLKGTYHFNEGYYYFRNIDGRVLFGGGRNLDVKTEETTSFGHTDTVQKKLTAYLHHMILPGQNAKVDYWWSGIMGFGNELTPIIKQLGPNIFCGVRCNGMGIAMGSLVGEEVAALALKN